ncbi:unnamed protein product [Mycena citricolor]|uniref:Cytochrome P450 n=1 Tax=Mycena citricolor TaxID=2018698 RepID=A0AAD2K2W4_9AGAR|nr:unnamed protein product [Mycena citricolor]
MHLAHGDGPRMCLGAEMSGVLIKVVLAVLVGSFAFELPGNAQVVEDSDGRPKSKGRGAELLMIVRRA